MRTKGILLRFDPSSHPSIYSYLNEVTGLALAALNALKITVTIAIIIARNAEKIKTSIPIEVL
jgi:hypothetical protein